MPGVSGVTVVTMLVCFHFHRTQGCGCIERPAFPAPSDFEGADTSGITRAKTRGEIAEAYLDVIARSASDEAIHACFAEPWIASLTLAKTG